MKWPSLGTGMPSHRGACDAVQEGTWWTASRLIANKRAVNGETEGGSIFESPHFAHWFKSKRRAKTHRRPAQAQVLRNCSDMGHCYILDLQAEILALIVSFLFKGKVRASEPLVGDFMP